MRWIWIDRILVLDKGVRSVAIKNVSLAEEVLHDHFAATATQRAEPVFPATLMIEGMAQTAGILVGHARDFKEKVLLAKIGKAAFTTPVRPGQTIRYAAHLDRIDDTGASTTGIVELIDLAINDGQPQQIGQVDLMFSHIDQNMRGLAFPDYNFVFTGQFMDLLARSGFSTPAPGS